ncbi:hypothetical protein Q2T83_03860 [Fervidibacter sacchari]|uniref:DUF4365 domain-containing protein n=1 Tax=Candidatus Fervidibacter sacchari TaxID=1448929 RepID=A0ABT2EPE2_9BACT|nr:hypothetical protein [Candidatus Fervidibacter sacchari]MCS3919797.1 hypothetical protein [Candidatus Fervidibacter sacchari]WKU16962.1 hypothetical protein Q2T83_03860 [Candidatus Fervidibacter sacchari]
MSAQSVPTTFFGRKQLEAAAWRVVKKAFERHGWRISPVGLHRSSLILPEAEPLVMTAPHPPTIIMLVCVPDAIAVHEPTRRSWLVELKSTNRETFALRARDFAALLMWQALLVVAHLPTGTVYACPVEDLPPPKLVMLPHREGGLSLWDEGGLTVLQSQFPEVEVLTGVTVVAGSKAPFGVWEISGLQKLEAFL